MFLNILQFEADRIAAPSGWSLQKFIQNFREELRDQFRGATKK
jgi:hypothetical protein